jgi:lipopolysaccharide export system permease protein
MPYTIDRYLIREIALPFLFILLILTFVLLMGRILQLMDLMVNKGVLFSDIALLILYLMPSFLVFTLPISLLFAIMMALGRLSTDNEITVLKASGVGLLQLARPVLIMGLSCFALTALTSYVLAPQGNSAAKTLLLDAARHKVTLGIKEKVFNDDFTGILLYADKEPVSGDYLEGVLISDQRLGTEPSTIIARRAYLISDPGSHTIALRLEGGSIHTVDRDLKNYRKMDFALYDVRLDLGSSMGDDAAKRKVSTEMSAKEILERLQGGSLKEEDRRETGHRAAQEALIPASCLVFSILAVPLGIRRNDPPNPMALQWRSSWCCPFTSCVWAGRPWPKPAACPSSWVSGFRSSSSVLSGRSCFSSSIGKFPSDASGRTSGGADREHPGPLPGQGISEDLRPSPPCHRLRLSDYRFFQ